MAAKSYALTTAGTPSQLYYSEDLGITWVSLNPTGLSFSDLSGGGICDVAVGPYNPDEVLITGPAGIRRSTDGAATFVSASTFPGKYLFYKDANSVVSISSTQLSVSDNGGGTWTTVAATPASLYPAATDPMFSAVYFSNYSTGFVAINGEDGSGAIISKIWKTINAGSSWVNGIELTGLSNIVSIHGNDEQGILLVLTENSGLWRLDYNLLQDPVLVDASIIGNLGGELRQVGGDPNKIYIITDGSNTQNIYYSGDGGYTFALRSSGLFGQTPYPRIFAFDESLIIALTAVVAGSEAALYRSEDGGVTLTNQFTSTVDGRAIGLDSSVSLECDTCPVGFTYNEGTKKCEKITLGGPICYPPYFYDTITGQCASIDTSTAVNISLSIDISGSVTDEERIQYIIFLKSFIDELLERLASNNTQMAITLWNSVACLQQDWTNDPDLLKGAIDAVRDVSGAPDLACAGMGKSGGTKHARALETSVRALYQGALDRPNASNFLVNVTDGDGIGGPCDLSDLGYSIVIPAADQDDTTVVCPFLKLVQQIKQNLAGKPSTFMMLVVGDVGERNGVANTFKNTSCDGIVYPFPSANEAGDLFFYDAGNFNEANDFAKQLIIGLGAQFTPSPSGCPPGCTAVPGVDSLGYCRCLDSIPYFACTYKLVDCLDDTITLVSNTDLAQYYDNNEIITIQDYTNCWRIEKLDFVDPAAEAVIVTEVFPTCNECALSFSLTNCRDTSVVIYTIQEEFIPFSDPSKVVVVDEYPGECWTVRRNTEAGYTPEVLTLNAKSYDDCESCLGNYFYLTSCSEEQSFIMTDTDLTEYLDQTVSIKGYPGACFIVEKEACNCISVKLFSKVSGLKTYKVERAPVLINGRNQYNILTNKNERFLIAFNTEENRWEVWNIMTNTLLSYSKIATECPYTGLWDDISESDFKLISITSCVTSIYTVEIDGTYLGCECCLYKNC
jgi:hypothetical protein